MSTNRVTRKKPTALILLPSMLSERGFESQTDLVVTMYVVDLTTLRRSDAAPRLATRLAWFNYWSYIGKIGAASRLTLKYRVRTFRFGVDTHS